jgi:hypothetical protein
VRAETGWHEFKITKLILMLIFIQVGQIIMQAAGASNIKRTTLELGGVINRMLEKQESAYIYIFK